MVFILVTMNAPLREKRTLRAYLLKLPWRPMNFGWWFQVMIPALAHYVDGAATNLWSRTAKTERESVTRVRFW
jgi:hypothetical protein